MPLVGRLEFGRLNPDAGADIEARAKETHADKHPDDEPLNHLSPRDVTGHISGRRRDRFRQIRFRRFRARSHCRLCGHPRFRENASRFRRNRFGKLQIQAFIILECEDHEPKGVILA